MADQVKKTDFQFVRFKKAEHMPGYHGFDGARDFTLEDGDVEKVSEAKAKQLFEDFPKNFESGTEKEFEASQKVRIERNEKRAKLANRGRRQVAA